MFLVIHIYNRIRSNMSFVSPFSSHNSCKKCWGTSAVSAADSVKCCHTTHCAAFCIGSLKSSQILLTKSLFIGKGCRTLTMCFLVVYNHVFIAKDNSIFLNVFSNNSSYQISHVSIFRIVSRSSSVKLCTMAVRAARPDFCCAHKISFICSHAASFRNIIFIPGAGHNNGGRPYNTGFSSKFESYLLQTVHIIPTVGRRHCNTLN